MSTDAHAPPPGPPRTEAELLERAHALAGCSLAQLARLSRRTLPATSRRAKGWTGQTLERLLGATAGSRSEPDFQALGVELKTIPVGHDGQPKESTYVCTLPLLSNELCVWETSNVCRKLSRVMWFPVEGGVDIPLPERHVGFAIIWSPSPQEEMELRADWEELTEMVNVGRLAEITGRHGVHLQVRPKAANARALRWATDEQGAPLRTLPRGFYLRASFTAHVLREHYVMSD